MKVLCKNCRNLLENKYCKLDIAEDVTCKFYLEYLCKIRNKNNDCIKFERISIFSRILSWVIRS